MITKLLKWLRHYAPSQKVMGSRPDEVTEFHHNYATGLEPLEGCGQHATMEVPLKVLFSMDIFQGYIT